MGMMLFTFVEQLILYQLGAYVCFDLKVKMPWAQVAGAGLCVLLGYIAPADMPEYLVAYGVMWLVIFVSLREKWRKRLWHVGVLFILISGMEEIVEIPGTYLVEGYENDWKWTFPELGVKLLLLFSIWVFRKMLKGQRRRKFDEMVKRVIPGILVGMICCLFFTVNGLEWAYEISENSRFHIFVACVASVSMIFAWLLGLATFYVRDMNEKLWTLNQQEEELRLAQEEYYKSLLQREEDTRRFRHDLVNHLMSVKELAEERDWGKVDDYLKSFKQEVKQIQGRKYDTGNKILDTMSTYLLAKVDENVNVRLNSQLETPISVDSMSLCTIYSNLLKNAAEETTRCADAENRYIKIEIWSDAEWLKIEIENSKTGAKDLKKTSKSDQRNHGFGIQNVEEKVKKLNGQISFTQKDHIFLVEVSLPNVLTV